MRYWYYLRMARRIHERTYREYTFLLPILMLLLVCILSFLSFVTHLYDDNIALIINLITFYLLILYNQPLITREFHNKKFLTFHTKSTDRLQFLIYLLFENNPILIGSILYTVINLIWNIFNPAKIFILLYALLVVFCLFFMKQIPKGTYRNVGIILLYGVICVSCWFKGVIPLLFVFVVGSLFYVTRNLNTICFEENKELNLQRSSFNTTENHFLPQRLIVRKMIRNSYKVLFWILVSAVLGFLAQQLLHARLSSLFLFIEMLNFELLIDEKYKHLSKYIPKYYFIKNGTLNFGRRYMISDHYFQNVKSSLYLVSFGIANSSAVVSIGFYILLLFWLGIIYFYIEERMYEKQLKTNSLLFQYGVFVMLSIAIYLIQAI